MNQAQIGSGKPTGSSRRDVLKMGLGAAALALRGQSAQASETSKAQSSGEQPNILLLMTDQHRGDCVGVDGNPVIRTPNLDWIARDGAHFRCGYSSVPSCTPARAGLLTGMSPWNHGMLGYSRVAPKYPVEMPRILREAGYYTFGIGKMHYHPQRALHGFHNIALDESGRVLDPAFRSDYRCWFASTAPGLDPDATGIGWNDYRAKTYALPEELHPTNWTGATAVNFLKRYDRAEPFFLKVSFARPHSPYDAPERFMKMYEDADLPKRAVGKWAARNAPVEKTNYNRWRGDLGEEQARHSRQGYYGNITFIDEQIGKILETLEERGMLDNTVILVCADHGDMLGDHHMWRKTYAYESSARIPFMLRWPKGFSDAKRGQVLSQPVELRDVLPTFMEAASTSIDTQLDGRSLFELVRGETDSWRPFIDLEHAQCYSPDNYWHGLSDGREKFVFHVRSGEEQLFNLEKDPTELDDLAPQSAHQKRLAFWRKRLVDFYAERGEPFVVNGKLASGRKSELLSPNYPKWDEPKKG